MFRAIRIPVPIVPVAFLGAFLALALLVPQRAAAKTIFHATCGNLYGERVDMDPNGRTNKEKWKHEFYRAGPPPNGQGTLEFVSEDTDLEHVIIHWTEDARALPIVYKSDTQISLADVDDFGVWIFTLYYRAGKVLVTRQTTNPGPGAIGAILVGNCTFAEK